MSKIISLCAVFVLLGTAFPALATNPCVEQGIRITHPQLRATPPGALAAGGYMRVKNTGTHPQRLIGVAADFAAKSELHTMHMNDGIMKMHPIDGGVLIKAGGAVSFLPKAKHLMFMGLKQQLTTGVRHSIQLRFDRCGTLVVPFTVTKSPLMKHGN